MRVFQPDNKLLRILASEIEEKKKPIRIIAQGQNTALDEATESAKAYWMMGWTWEEIDSILEDSGFSAKAIASAIKAAQKYAYECLKDGPFKTLKEGQLVKLKSGLVGKLVNKYAEHISVHLQKQAQFEEDPSVMYLPKEFGQDINIGDRVEVSEGSGVMSGVEGTVIDRSKVKTDGRGIPTNVPGAYQPVDWNKEVALQLDNGSIELMFIDRLRKVGTIENKVEITKDKIDFETSAKLQKAHTLRESAKKIMKKAQQDIYTTEEGTELQVPGAPTKGPLISPDPEDVWEKPYTQERTPPGWAKHTPSMGNVEEVTQLANAALQDLDTLLMEKREWEADKKKLVAESKEIQEVINKMEKRESEIAKNVFAIIATEDKALDDLDIKVFSKYKEKLLGLEKKLQTTEVTPTYQQELDAVYEFLTENHPEIVANIKGAMDFWMKQHSFMKEKILSKLHYYPAPREKRGQTWDKIKSWVLDVWDTTKQFFNTLTNKTFPMVDDGIAKIDALESAAGLVQTANKVKKALRVYFK